MQQQTKLKNSKIKKIDNLEISTKQERINLQVST